MNRLAKAAKVGAFSAGLMLLVAGNDPDGPVIAGVTGAVVTLLMLFSLSSQARKADGFRQTLESEGLVMDARASLRDAWDSHEGWLFLLKQRLVFEPFRSTDAKLRFDARLEELEVALTRTWFGRLRIEVVAKGPIWTLTLDDPETWFVMLKRTTAAATGAAETEKDT